MARSIATVSCVPSYTLSQLIADIDPTCFPASATSQRQINLVNWVREAFYFPPDKVGGNVLWNGIIVKTQLPITPQFAWSNGFIPYTITTTRQLDTVVMAFDRYGPVPIRNNWQVFGNPDFGIRQLNDQDDGWAGITSINTNGATMSVTTTTNESTALTIQFFGTDVNGNTISETVAIPTVSETTVSSAKTYYSVQEVVKSVTAGNIVVHQVTSGIATLFASYQPNELTPNYRRYFLNFASPSTEMNVKCKRRYYQLVNGTDQVEFNSVLAFNHALKGYRWFQNNDMDSWNDVLTEAIGILNGVERNYQSETAYGSLQLDPMTAISSYNAL